MKPARASTCFIDNKGGEEVIMPTL